MFFFVSSKLTALTAWFLRPTSVSLEVAEFGISVVVSPGFLSAPYGYEMWWLTNTKNNFQGGWWNREYSLLGIVHESKRALNGCNLCCNRWGCWGCPTWHVLAELLFFGGFTTTEISVVISNIQGVEGGHRKVGLSPLSAHLLRWVTWRVEGVGCGSSWMFFFFLMVMFDWNSIV